MNDKKVDQVVLLELVKRQLMVSRCGNLPEEMHASFSISACGHVCSAVFDCKSMFSIHNQNSSYLRDALCSFDEVRPRRGFFRAGNCIDGGTFLYFQTKNESVSISGDGPNDSFFCEFC